MLRDNLVGLIEPMQISAGADPLALSIQKQASDDRSLCLENPRPEGAESSLTENVTSPFQAEPDTTGHLKTLKCVWQKTLHRAKVSYFRIYDLRSAYATRLSAGGVADEWVTQLLRQGDSQVFKKYSQMKLQMKREALQKLERAN